MKFPILYEQNETDFFILGLGPLTNSTKATVTEERNGAFYFEGEVLTNSEQFKLLKNDMIIKADAGHTLKNQRFRIKRIVDKHDGIAEIYAEHISYLAQELSLKPEVSIKSADGNGVITRWKNSIIDKNPFVVDSDVTTTASTKWEIGEVDNAREALGGVKGSILDNWGGEYRFDNYHISLLQKRGKPADTLLAYGRNITDFEQERNITNTYTSVFPFARYTDDKQSEHLVTIDNYIVDSKYVDNYPNRKALPVDFSDKFEHEEKPTKEKLVKLAETYIKSNEIGIPKTSIRVSFLDLSKASMYDVFQPLEQLSLCDDVRVEYPLLGVSTVSKVIKTVWNVLTDSYDEIEIGEKRTTLSTTIKEQQEAIKEVEKNVNGALVAANGKNMVFYGLYGENGLGEPVATMIGDMWYKPVGEDIELYIWNGTIWEFIMSTAPDDTIKEKIEELEQTSKDISESVDKALEEAEIALKESNISKREASEAREESFRGKVIAEEARLEAEVARKQGDGNKLKIEDLNGTLKITNNKVDGQKSEIATIKLESNRLSQSFLDLDGNVSTLEQTVNGFQKTVKSDINGLKSEQSLMAGQFTSTVEKVNNLYTPKPNIIINSMNIMLNKSDNGTGTNHPYVDGYFSFRTGNVEGDVYNDTDALSTEARGNRVYTFSFDANGFGTSFDVYLMIGKGVWQGPFTIPKSPSGMKRHYIKVNYTSGAEGRSIPIGIRIANIPKFSRFEYGKFKLVTDYVEDLYEVAHKDVVEKSEIVQLENLIDLNVKKIEKTDGKIIEQQGQISILNRQLNLKVEETQFNELNKEVSIQKGQIKILSDNIDLKVSANEVISRINMSPERIRIDSKLIHLSGQTLIDNAVIKNAMIANGAIDNAKIQNATISDAKIISITANKVVARDLSAITTNTGTLNISGWMSILTDNMGIKGSFDYGDMSDTATFQRWHQGNFSISHRVLAFKGHQWKLRDNGSKGTYHGWSESTYGMNHFKSRLYTNLSETSLIGRVDIRDDFIQVNDNWVTDETSGTWIKPNYIVATSARLYDVSAKPSVNYVYFNEFRKDLADFRIGKDGVGKAVVSEAIYKRTYNSQPTMCVTDEGRLGRIVSAKKYKDNIEVADDVISKSKTILSIEPKSWEAKNSDSGIRHYGFIADDFHESDLKEVVLYSHDEVEGLSYDRITMYHNVVLSEHEKEIESLKRRIEKLEEELDHAS